ncbi:MAG: hypothetical protein ACFE8J_17940 [Candidatus Heimdallarchaeota archaeon]
MATKINTGYCNNCQQKVMLSREKFNNVLGILLFFFTGIGFFIYLIIYYSKPKDHCIHCHTKISTQFLQEVYQPKTQEVYNRSNEKVEKISGTIPRFCAFCGEELISENSKHCPNCGTKI